MREWDESRVTGEVKETGCDVSDAHRLEGCNEALQPMGIQEAGDTVAQILPVPHRFLAGVPCCLVLGLNCIRTEICVYSGF